MSHQKNYQNRELQHSYGSLIGEWTDNGMSTRAIATYMEAEYNLQLTHKDVVRVLKAIEEDKRPRTCSIDDMAQYVDEALAICLAGPQMNYSQLFQELQKILELCVLVKKVLATRDLYSIE